VVHVEKGKNGKEIVEIGDCARETARKARKKAECA
jgi:hypothetical protein